MRPVPIFYLNMVVIERIKKERIRQLEIADCDRFQLLKDYRRADCDRLSMRFFKITICDLRIPDSVPNPAGSVKIGGHNL